MGERCEVPVALVGREHAEGLLHPCDPLVDPALLVEDPAEPGGRPRCRMRLPADSKRAVACSKRACGRAEAPARPGRFAGALEQRAARRGVVGKLRRLLVAASTLPRCAASDAARSPARASRSQAFALIAAASSASGAALYGLEVVGGDDFDDLVFGERSAWR